MVGFDDGSEDHLVLDGENVGAINSDLASGLNINGVVPLKSNEGFSFQGPVRVGDFDVSLDETINLLALVNPHEPRPAYDTTVCRVIAGRLHDKNSSRHAADYIAACQ
jgi:hypothetical protein